MNTLSEQEMTSRVVARLSGLGIEHFTEVPIMSRSADLVLMAGGEIISVEFKLKDWSRAIAQAKDHLMSVDKSYICLSSKSVSTVAMEAAARHGIGIYCLDDSQALAMREVVPARTSQRGWSVAREWLQSSIEKRRQQKI